MTKGTYGGGTLAGPWGIGGGLYFDNHGRIYPQFYAGTPGFGLSAGYTDDLEGFLTGTSVSGSLGRGPVRVNAGTSGGTSGFGIGTPGGGMTYGVGPFEMAQDYSRPWAKPYIHDSVAAAGVPSRYNVWEYDFPNPETASDAAGSAKAQRSEPSGVPGSNSSALKKRRQRHRSIYFQSRNGAAG